MLSRNLITIIFFSVAFQAKGATINVYPGQGNLQTTIDKADRGDTLIVHQGLYKEHDILVNKKLTIKGDDFPVIDGGKKYQLFFITADSVVIEGLQVQNTGRSSMTDMAGIRLQNVSHVIVRNNLLLYNTYGIYLQNSSYCAILNNIALANAKDELNNGNGIHAWKCNHLLIRNNKISGHRDGIYFEFVTDSKISHNISILNVRYGLHFMFSSNDAYLQNQFVDNGAGVAVMFSKNVIMLNNTFRHNWGDAAYGILLKEISDSKIEHNYFTKNTVAIYMEGTNRINVANNEFDENGWAMRIQASCNANMFEGNNFQANSFDVATNGTMMLNTFDHNYWDKYDGYDLDKDKTGDVPYYPVSIYAVVTERVPVTMILYRSFLTDIMDQVEKVLPSVIPEQLKDDHPMMKKWDLK
ncbi:MAG: nitrous oxide reductase family maturation protein NosD [Bacteroidetes bacterium]|nr:nitrous oxide reductase family maturation protein NosD [Bacteroidota bacterium]